MSGFEFEHPRPDLLSERGMACNRGCFQCGPDGQRHNHEGTGCCNSFMCNPPRWALQVHDWLTIEQRYNLAFEEWGRQRRLEEYYEAEEAFREELRAKAKAHVEHVPPKPNNPSRRRGVTVAVRQKQAHEMRSK